MTCAIQDCGRPAGTRGWCSMHYHRWQRHGDPLVVRTTMKGEAPTYGAIHRRLYRSRGPASAYECAQCGAPADHWSYDHSDPDEFYSPANARGDEAPYSLSLECYEPLCGSCHAHRDKPPKVTHCKRGHAYTPENTYVYADGRRNCRLCHALRERAAWMRRNAREATPWLVSQGERTHREEERLR